jgi:hypothetical protein
MGSGREWFQVADRGEGKEVEEDRKRLKVVERRRVNFVG